MPYLRRHPTTRKYNLEIKGHRIASELHADVYATWRSALPMGCGDECFLMFSALRYPVGLEYTIVAVTCYFSWQRGCQAANWYSLLTA